MHTFSKVWPKTLQMVQREREREREREEGLWCTHVYKTSSIQIYRKTDKGEESDWFSDQHYVTLCLIFTFSSQI